jgi:hypothetical protein
VEFYTRDELWTGRRLMVQADGDDDLGAVLTIIDTNHDHRTICVDLRDVESLAGVLAQLADRGLRPHERQQSSGPHHALSASTIFAPQSVNRLRWTYRIRCTASIQRTLGSPSPAV